MPRKLKYGQGSITERKRVNKNGSVYHWYETKWIDKNGIRHTKTCGNNTECRNVLKQNRPMSIRRTTSNQRTTFRHMFQEWYNVFRKPNISEKQDAAYQYCMNKIPADIAEKSINNIDVQKLQEHINSLTSAKYKYWTKMLITAFYEKLCISGIIKTNIGKTLIANQPISAERQTLSREDEPKLLALLPNDIYRSYVIGYINTGCRLSELIRINKPPCISFALGYA
jgi:integrase